MNINEKKRKSRHLRIRKKVSGSSDKPRLCVHRSLTNFYAQVIDDNAGKILFGVSTLNKDLKQKIKYGGNINAAEALGEMVAKKAADQGIKRLCFDRGGYKYHGRVKAFAEAVRNGGLEF